MSMSFVFSGCTVKAVLGEPFRQNRHNPFRVTLVLESQHGIVGEIER